MSELFNTNTNAKDSSKNIATQWYAERSRQARASFNLAITLATATVIFTVATAVSVCLNNVPATTAVGLISGVASKRLFQLYEDTNKKLDEAAKELSDNQQL